MNSAADTANRIDPVAIQRTRFNGFHISGRDFNPGPVVHRQRSPDRQHPKVQPWTLGRSPPDPWHMTHDTQFPSLSRCRSSIHEIPNT